jgi:uroporphyrinogen decarboxylase
MEVITDSLMGFVKACIRLGLDGFYTSTQGGEAGRLESKELFDACVRPYDLALMDEINHSCGFNILHVCDYAMPYSDLSPFVKYPGQIVNCSLELAEGKEITPVEVAGMFERPFMGGLNRLGILAKGTVEEVRAAARAACAQLPERAILGADCTVPGDTPWENLKAAIEVAHTYRK